jgi:predicted dehydrogenase
LKTWAIGEVGAMGSDRDMDRRDFLRRTGEGAALLGVGTVVAEAAARIPQHVDPHAPKTGRLPRHDDILGIGVIGVGGQGNSHLGDLLENEKNGEKVAVRAVADCYLRRQKRAVARTKEAVGRDIEAYTDYRRLLERDDIDAVVIATPDHWHALNSIHAMEAGKDVYCEKPVTLTIEEAIAVRNAAYRTGRVFQCGAQHSSNGWVWAAREFIKKGGIGKVLWAQSDVSRNSAGGPDNRGGEWNWPIDSQASDRPGAGDFYVDWEQWLGPAKKRPWSPPRFFQFRKFWDYSGGIATDLLYHMLSPLTIALDAQAPEMATAAGGIFIQKDDREVPDTFFTTLNYPDDYSIVLTSSMANSQANPTMIRGHFATIRVTKDDRDTAYVAAEPQFKEWFVKEYGAEEIALTHPSVDHRTFWRDAVRSRGPVNLDAETAYRAMAGIKMGVDAYRAEKTISWDGAREKYTRRHPRPHRDSKAPRA